MHIHKPTTCLLTLVASLFSALHCFAQNESTESSEQDDTRIQCNRTDKQIDIEQLVDAIEKSDVIFLGEQHDNDSGHLFQLHVIRTLAQRGHAVAVSMEQFERDTQGAINDYLAGRIDEKQFLATSRPWKNYPQHYRPIVEFAKQTSLPIIAGNIPRRIAGDVAQGKPVAFADRAYAPRNVATPKDVYWQKFKATMEGHMGTGSEDKMEKFYASQCLKDDAMAEAITDFLATNSHRRTIVVHLCGHFHSDYGLGTVARVVSRRPLTQCTVITMESSDSEKNKPKPTDLKNRAHFVYWTVKNTSQETKANADQ